MSVNVVDERPLLQGVVTRKNRGQYLVQKNGHGIQCTISNKLRKKLLYPLADPASLGHYSVQRVEDIDVVDPVAVGDQVQFIDLEDGTGHIIEVLPRRNQLSRSSPRPEPWEQVLVANVDRVVPVFAATRPKPSWKLLDRYLVTAEAVALPVLICITKLDLLEGSRGEGKLRPMLELYERLGYPVVLTSAVTGRGIDEIRAALSGRLSLLMGKSGVGKTSLLNAMQPGLGLRVKAVGKGSKGKGRHTTTHLELFPLEGGGGVVDTPGMREFALWNMDAQEVAGCFPEMRPYLGTCKFGASCRHDSEPGCAVKAALDAGHIARPRYESYLKLAEEMA